MSAARLEIMLGNETIALDIDGPAAHVDEFARLSDRDGFPVGRHRFDRHTLHRDIGTSHGRPARTGPLNTLNKTYRYRVTEATATAQGRPSHENASMYTRRVSDALAVAVDCYAGARGEETPRRVTRGDQLVEILVILPVVRIRFTGSQT